MFKKKNDAEEVASEELTFAPETRKGYTPKKGVSTPTRKEATQANKRPIVGDKRKMSKEERREAKRRQAQERNAAWSREQQAMRTGDERHMPVQHAGPVRRFARDCMDARFLPNAIFMPLVIILFLSVFVQRRYPLFFTYFTIGVYAVFLVLAIWTGLVVRRVRVMTTYKFGEGKYPRGLSFQLFSRSFYPRRWRMPRPQVARGEYPKGGTPQDYREAKAAQK